MRKNSLIIILIIHNIIITSCNTNTVNSRSNNTNSIKDDSINNIKDYSGSWYWKSNDMLSSFKLELSQKYDSVYGQYCAAYSSGNRMDCNFDTFYNLNGKVFNGEVKLKFSTFYNAKNGQADLFLNKDTLIWSITKYPIGGDCYAPAQAKMVHKKW